MPPRPRARYWRLLEARASARPPCTAKTDRRRQIAVTHRSAHWTVWAHCLRGPDRGDAAGRDVDIPRATERVERTKIGERRGPRPTYIAQVLPRRPRGPDAEKGRPRRVQTLGAVADGPLGRGRGDLPEGRGAARRGTSGLQGRRRAPEQAQGALLGQRHVSRAGRAAAAARASRGAVRAPRRRVA